MMRDVLTWIVKTSILVVLIVLIWGVYLTYVKPEIKADKMSEMESDLRRNFYSKAADFNEFINLSNQIGKIRNLQFNSMNQVSFQIYNSSKLPDNNLDYTIDLGDDTLLTIDDIHFLDSNRIQVHLNDTLYLLNHWIINFDGSRDHPLLEKVLIFSGINLKQFNSIERYLKLVDCIWFDKSDVAIVFRYRGHWGEGFNYVIPINKTFKTSHLNSLSKEVYWEYYITGLYCGELIYE